MARMTTAQRAHMDKLREYRGLPPQTADNLMERTRAAVCFLNAGSGGSASRLNGFLALFHPEIDPGSATWRDLMDAARKQDERY